MTTSEQASRRLVRTLEADPATTGNMVLLIPDGVGVRNFVLGPFLRLAADQLDQAGKLNVLHVIPKDILPTYRDGRENVIWHSLTDHRERPLPFVLRNSLHYAHMHWVDSFAMRIARRRPPQGPFRLRAAYRTARLLGRGMSSWPGIRLLDRCHCAVISRSPEVDHYHRMFQEIKPRVLFCSHQRPPIILAPVLAARSLGIPTATFIFSWDNLTSKGRIAAPFDHYLVWSDHMRRELLRFYPDVSSDRVHIVGTPQFDPYADDSVLWPRGEFFRRIGADPSRPLICYSGGDAGNSPEDPEHVRVLLDHIRAGRIRKDAQVLLRPAPVDNGNRYAAVRHQYPELVYAQPEWMHTDPNDWSTFIPSAADLVFLANVTRHADLNINFGSTMTLDFAIHDRPVVNIAFDVLTRPFGMSLWDYQCQFEHYRPIIDFGAAKFARSAEDLAEHVNAYLADPTLDRDARRRLVELQVGCPVGTSSRRIVDVLTQIAR